MLDINGATIYDEDTVTFATRVGNSGELRKGTVTKVDEEAPAHRQIVIKSDAGRTVYRAASAVGVLILSEQGDVE